MFSHHIPDSSVSVTDHNISVIPKFFSNTYKHASSNVTQEKLALDVEDCFWFDHVCRVYFNIRKVVDEVW